MHTCMTGTVISFSAPFQLSGMVDPLPAGDYRVEHFWRWDEDAPQVSFSRTCSFIHPLTADGEGETRRFPIDPGELRSALAQDRARA